MQVETAHIAMLQERLIGLLGHIFIHKFAEASLNKLSKT